MTLSAETSLTKIVIHSNPSFGTMGSFIHQVSFMANLPISFIWFPCGDFNSYDSLKERDFAAENCWYVLLLHQKGEAWLTIIRQYGLTVPQPAMNSLGQHNKFELQCPAILDIDQW